MNHSDIYSQAVVEQDSDYLKDSFCVDTDDDDVEDVEEQFCNEESELPAALDVDADDVGGYATRNRNRNRIRNRNRNEESPPPVFHFVHLLS